MVVMVVIFVHFIENKTIIRSFDFEDLCLR